MTRIYLLIFTLLGFIPTLHAANADAVLDKCVKTLTASPSVTISYTLQAGGNSTSGATTLAGNKFLLDSPQLAMWFDGKTLWSLAKSQREVSITNPTDEELQQLNPLLVLDRFRKNFKATILKSVAGQISVKLMPKKAQTDIDAAVLTVSASNYLPQSILLTLANRQTVSIKILNIKPGIKLSDPSFRFNKRNYPSVDVIDLR